MDYFNRLEGVIFIKRGFPWPRRNSKLLRRLLLFRLHKTKKFPVQNNTIITEQRSEVTAWCCLWTSINKEVFYLRWNEHHLRAYFETLMSITSDISFWDRPCYQSMLDYGSDNKCQKHFDNIKVDFHWL